MGMGDLIDRAVFFYRINFIPIVTYAALFTVPLAILAALSAFIGPMQFLGNPDFLDSNPNVFGISSILSSTASLLVSVLSLLLLPFQIAGIGIALRIFLFENRGVSLGEMLSAVRQELASLLVLGFLGVMFLFLLLFTLIIPPVGLAILTLYFFALYLSPYVVLYEKRGDLDALRRSWNLLRHSVWRVLAYLLLFYIFNLLLGIIVGGLIFGVAAALTTVLENPLMLVLAQTLASSLTGILLSPIHYSVAGLLYFDLRIRHEGLDVALSAAQAAGEKLDLSIAPISEEPLLNQQTLKAVGLLSLAYTTLVGLFCGCLFLLIFAVASL
jgi:hypothetical protein